MALLFAGLALLLKLGLPILVAVRRNGKNGGGLDALGRASDLAALKTHIDLFSKESREQRKEIMENINNTRHDLAQPLQTAVGTLTLMEHLLEEIRDRLPQRLGDYR
jgi:hypothetical protein